MTLTPLFSEGFPLGEGLFETFRLPAVPNFKKHWGRMKNSAKILRFPFSFRMEEIEQELLAIISTVRPRPKAARISLLPSRSTKELFVQFPSIAQSRSWRLSVEEVVPSPRASHKTTKRETYEDLCQKAAAASAHDALLVTRDKEILETTRANIFFVSANALLTPPLDGKILPGIAREEMIEAARQIGIQVVEKPIFLEDLRGFREMFATNSVRGVVPITEIAGWWSLTPGGQMLVDELREVSLGNVAHHAVHHRAVLKHQ